MSQQDDHIGDVQRTDPLAKGTGESSLDESSLGQPFILITVRMIYIALMIAVAVLPFAGIIGATYLPHQGLNILAPIIATIRVAAPECMLRDVVQCIGAGMIDEGDEGAAGRDEEGPKRF